MIKSVHYHSICKFGDLRGFREVSLSNVKGIMYNLIDPLYSFKQYLRWFPNFGIAGGLYKLLKATKIHSK